jgi:hypothetical protein
MIRNAPEEMPMNRKLIQPARSLDTKIGAVQFPIFAVSLATPEQSQRMAADVTLIGSQQYPEGYPTPTLVKFAESHGPGMLIGPSMEECGTAYDVLMEVMPEYKPLVFVPMMFISSEDFFIMRRQMARAGHATQGYYQRLHWPGPYWEFCPWDQITRPSLSPN